MTAAIREEGFLIVETQTGSLSDGRIEFRKTKEEAADQANSLAQRPEADFPVYVIPGSRFITEEIRAKRGPNFR
jgi:hypothetical protein